MPLEPVTLDDLTWSALVTATRGRIPAASRGLWTLHAPVDPGVTLLELYAYLYEQRLYWMNEVTPELQRAVLALLGMRPKAAVVAGTVMQLASGSRVTVAAGTELRLIRGTTIVFTTASATTVLPLLAMRVFGGARDLTADLRHGREAEVFLGNESELRIEIDTAVPPGAGDPLGILFLLATDEAHEPEWQPGASAIEPAVTLEFLHRDPGGVWKKLDAVDDGTRGLRRSGVLRLRLPADWVPPASSGVATCHFAIRKTSGAFPFPPRLLAVEMNAVVATHRRAASTKRFAWPESQCPPLPRLQLPLASFSAATFDAGPPIEDTVALRLRERDGSWHKWTRVLDFAFAGPRDRVFVVDRERRTLAFGDGLTGRLPRPQFGAENVICRYRDGGGAAGNVGSSLQWKSSNANIDSAINVVAATGGADSESLTAAQSRLAASLRAVDRAVTEADYVALATSTPGAAIVRAGAAFGFHPCSPCVAMPGVVSVFVVPYAPRPIDTGDDDEGHYVSAPVPDRGTLAAVRARLDAARLVGTEVFVVAPRYRAVRLQIDVDAPAPMLRELESQLFRHLRAFLDPLGGIASPVSPWPFGEPLRPSVLRREAQQAAGTSAEIGSVSIGLDGEDPSENCREVAVGPNDLVYLAELRLGIQTAAVTLGGLR